MITIPLLLSLSITVVNLPSARPATHNAHLYRIYVVFENAHGDLFGAGTDLKTPSLEATDTMSDVLNDSVDLNRDQWKFLASAVFGSMEADQEKTAADRNTERGGGVTSFDPDEDW